MHPLTGTLKLFRLALRRDRIKLPILILVLAGAFYWPSVNATLDFYGKTAEQQHQYAAANAPSVIARVFNGPIDGPNFGAIVQSETFIWMALAIAFVSSMAVVRHTRQNEELGRSDLIESGVVARHASLAAAMLLTVLINLIFSVIVFAALKSVDLPTRGSLLTAGSIFATGMTFAALAALAVQLADNARTANSYGAIAIGAAFLLRAIGDGMGTVTADGLAVRSAWPSWLSPLGWAQQLFPFTQGRAWLFYVYTVFFTAVLGTAVLFMARRDIGRGMISTRLGRAKALSTLLSPFGLVRRLQRGILVGWSVVIVVFGVAFGFTIKEFESFLAENDQVREAFTQMGFSGDNYRNLFLSLLISMMAITITGYSVQALLRMRSEESNGQLEPVLAAHVGRIRWILGHIAFIYAGVLLLLTLLALSMGMTFILSTGAPIGEIWRVIGAALTQFAAIFAFSSFVVAVFAFLPRLAVALAWGGLAACLLIVQVGALLKLPQWIMDASPFIHLPAMPSSPFSLEPVLWLGGIGAILLASGVIRFRRRDLSTE